MSLAMAQMTEITETSNTYYDYLKKMRPRARTAPGRSGWELFLKLSACGKRAYRFGMPYYYYSIYWENLSNKLLDKPAL